MNKKQRIRVFLLITWMTIIFIFSSRPADISTQDSYLVGNLVSVVAQQWSRGDWSDQEQLLFVGNIDFYVRKAAHMIEYAVLGVLLIGCMKSFGLTEPRLWWGALAAGIIYAASDEFHQYFVPGRACQLRDVAIDGVGVVMGVIGSILHRWLRRTKL